MPTREMPERGGRTTALIAAAGLFQAAFVILVVNFWIYYARYLYIARYPVEASATPPTISRAISDPAIGQPFAVWISTSAILLFGAWVIVAWFNWAFAGSLSAVCGRSGARLKRSLAAMTVLQLLTSIGMVMLSCFPLATARDAHMIGSYLFFVCQALSVLVATVIAFEIARNPESCSALQARHGLPVGIHRIRAALGAIAVLLAITFGVLFVAKDIPGAQQRLVHQIYVISEPSAISSFLLVLATYCVELLASLRPAKVMAPIGTAS